MNPSSSSHHQSSESAANYIKTLIKSKDRYSQGQNSSSGAAMAVQTTLAENYANATIESLDFGHLSIDIELFFQLMSQGLWAKSLKLLRMSFCGLEGDMGALLRRLSLYCDNLQSLDLSRNDFSNKEDGRAKSSKKSVFSALRQKSSSSVSKINEQAPFWTSLKHLDISVCRLDVIPTELSKFVNLEFLSLARSLRATAVASSFASIFHSGAFPMLSHLDLSDNDLSKMTLEPCSQCLKHVSLQNCCLGAQTGAAAFWLSLCGLKHLNIAQNPNISEVPLADLVANSTNTLSYFNISGCVNLRSQIEGCVSQMGATMQFLGLARLALSELPFQDLTKLTGLQELDLSWNKLQGIPCQLPARLVTLNLSNNDLVSMTALGEASRFPSLRTLNLDHNGIESRDELERFIMNCPSINYVSVDQNLVDARKQGWSAEFEDWKQEKQVKAFAGVDQPSQITDDGRLFLANAIVASNKYLLKRLGVTHVLTVANDLPDHIRYPVEFEYLVIEIEDAVGEDLKQHFSSTLSFIENAFAKDSSNKVLVHCRAGVSRSATIVTAFVMKSHRKPYDAALEYVRERRPIVCPNLSFRKQLQ